MPESFEMTEKPNSNRERMVGLIISVIAVALAIVSSAAHEAQNEEIVENVKSSDKYALYQSRKDRALQLQLSIDSAQKIDQLTAKMDRMSPAPIDADLTKYQAKLDHEDTESDQDLKEAQEIDATAAKTARKASILDIAEIALQVSIVMCSITVLTEIMIFVRMGVASAVVGVLVALYAVFF